MTRLSIVIPCFNEEATLETCVNNVLAVQSDQLSLDLIIVDDASIDDSFKIALDLEKKHEEVRVFHHEINQGKGAALSTGFKHALGDFVAVQDADLEYDPFDFKRLIKPLESGKADVVLGSRFLSTGSHRVLYFWHSMGNRFLTFFSNIFTDLNLTDMETCYKIFKREVIQDIEIEEKRFGFEPEIVAKIAHKRLRIYEAGISYNGRTYEEGKKIGIKDGIRAIYCILRYNASHAPLFLQFMVYLFIGGLSALCNLVFFLSLYSLDVATIVSAPVSFIAAAVINYLLCILVLFKHRVKWSAKIELLIFGALVSLICVVDWGITDIMLQASIQPWKAKLTATAGALVLNFLARRFVVFPESPSGPWKPHE